MTTIKNTTTGEIIELECWVEGANILNDVMGGSGAEITALTGEEVDRIIAAGNTNAPGWAYALDNDGANWWIRWAEREERICAAYESANEEERAAYLEAVDLYGHDMELLQDKEEEALGLATE